MIEHQWEMHGLLRRHYGIVTANELEQSDAGLHADPRFGEIGYLIEDLRGCAALVEINAEELRRSSFAHVARLHWPDSFRHAWVSHRSTPALFGSPSSVA